MLTIMSNWDNANMFMKQNKRQEEFKLRSTTVAIAKRMAEQNIIDVDWLQLLWAINFASGQLLGDDDSVLGLSAYEQSIAVARRLIGRENTNPEWQLYLEESYRGMGEMVDYHGNAEKALEYYQQSLTIAQTWSAQDASNPDWQRALELGYANMGDMYVEQRKYEEARSAYDQSLTLAKRLAEQEPVNSKWQRDLELAYERVGIINRKMKLTH